MLAACHSLDFFTILAFWIRDCVHSHLKILYSKAAGSFFCCSRQKKLSDDSSFFADTVVFFQKIANLGKQFDLGVWFGSFFSFFNGFLTQQFLFSFGRD